MLQFALALALGSVAVPTQVGQLNPLEALRAFGPRMDRASEQAVSGHKNGTRRPLATVDSGGLPVAGFVAFLSWGEVLDKPVVARVKTKAKVDGAARIGDDDFGSGALQTKTFDFFTHPARFVRGVRVCTTERDDDNLERLKGVRVKTAILKDGGFVAEEEVEPQVLPNCQTWHEWSTCPAGQAATQIAFYQQSAGPNQGAIRGLSVVCAPPLSVTK